MGGGVGSGLDTGGSGVLPAELSRQGSAKAAHGEALDSAGCGEGSGLASSTSEEAEVERAGSQAQPLDELEEEGLGEEEPREDGSGAGGGS